MPDFLRIVCDSKTSIYGPSAQRNAECSDPGKKPSFTCANAFKPGIAQAIPGREIPVRGSQTPATSGANRNRANHPKPVAA